MMRSALWLLVAAAVAFDAYILAKLMALYSDALEAWLLETSTRNAKAFYITMGGLAFGESMPFASMILPFWGILAGIGTILPKTGLNFWWVVTAVAVGAALGDWIAYTLGYYGEEWVKRKGLLNPEAKGWYARLIRFAIPRMHDWLNHVWIGPLVITLARFSGPFRATVPVFAGVVQMNWWLFQAANWTSAFLWAYVLLGSLDVFYRIARWVGEMIYQFAFWFFGN